MLNFVIKELHIMLLIKFYLKSYSVADDENEYKTIFISFVAAAVAQWGRVFGLQA